MFASLIDRAGAPLRVNPAEIATVEPGPPGLVRLSTRTGRVLTVQGTVEEVGRALGRPKDGLQRVGAVLNF